MVVYQTAPAATPFATKLVFRPLSAIATGPTTALPALVNAAGTTVSNPTFTRDGRYLAFIRRISTGFPRLFVFDTQTQLLLNTSGVTAGPGTEEGGIALELQPVLGLTGIRADLITFSLATASTVGIIVQRIVGTTRVLGRRAPRLEFVGRVPLGGSAAARNATPSAGTSVNGTKLPPGAYLVTVRSVTTKGQVRDLGKPVARSDSVAPAGSTDVPLDDRGRPAERPRFPTNKR